MDLSLPVVETFTSLQGESTHAGRVCFFIRCAGCNLKCSYCDTLYAADDSVKGTLMTVASLVEAAENSKTNLVEVTGGEPLIHSAVPLLCRELIKKGFEVLVETNGSFDRSVLDSNAAAIIDVKTPSSGMEKSFCFDNLKNFQHRDEFKFIISDRNDFDYAVDFVKKHFLSLTGSEKKVPALIFSPAAPAMDYEILAKWIIEANLPVRMQLQMHKIIWGNKPGV
jgi:7-carboxy-7-deazaguanine synthase